MTDTDDTTDTEAAEQRGADIADGTADRLARVTAGTVAFGTRLIPKLRERLYRRLTTKSLKGYYKTAPGDAIGLIAEPGQKLDLRPVGYRAPKDCEEHQKPGWVERGGDKVWNAGTEGRVVDYLGDTPIVALERDSHVEAGWLKPRIAQAIEFDNYDGLYTNPEINADVVADLSVDSATGGGAVADGGTQPGVVDVGLQDLGQYQGAQILDLDSGDGYDGMRIDFGKASDWAFETTASEELEKAQERGRLKGMLGTDQTDLAKVYFWAAIFALLVIATVTIGPSLVGGGGGGGGINPLTVMPAFGL